MGLNIIDISIDEIIDEFINTEKFIKVIGYNSYNLNLWEANKEVLKEKGFNYRNIIVSEICISFNNDILYSYRRENGNTERMSAIIKIKH